MDWVGLSFLDALDSHEEGTPWIGRSLSFHRTKLHPPIHGRTNSVRDSSVPPAPFPRSSLTES